MSSIFDVRKIEITGPDDVWERWVYVRDDGRHSAGLIDDIILDPPVPGDPLPGRLALFVRLADGRHRRVNTRLGVEIDLASERDVTTWLTQTSARTVLNRRLSLAIIPVSMIIGALIAGTGLDAAAGTAHSWLLIFTGAAAATSVIVTASADRAMRAEVEASATRRLGPVVAAHLSALNPERHHLDDAGEEVTPAPAAEAAHRTVDKEI